MDHSNEKRKFKKKTTTKTHFSFDHDIRTSVVSTMNDASFCFARFKAQFTEIKVRTTLDVCVCANTYKDRKK